MVNGKVYIGQTMNKRGYRERWMQHRYNAKYKIHDNRFMKAINKYGDNSFDKMVLEEIECSNKEKLKNKLDKLEIEYIKKYDSFNNGYNSTKGGDFNPYSSGDSKLVEKTKIQLLSTRARNEIYNSLKIKYVNLNNNREYIYNVNNIEIGMMYRCKKEWINKHTRNFKYISDYSFSGWSVGNRWKIRSIRNKNFIKDCKMYSIEDLGNQYIDEHMEDLFSGCHKGLDLYSYRGKYKELDGYFDLIDDIEYKIYNKEYNFLSQRELLQHKNWCLEDILEIIKSKEPFVKAKYKFQNKEYVKYNVDKYDKSEIIKSLILMEDIEDVNDDLWAMKLDLNKILKSIDLSDNQKFILDLWSRGFKQNYISDKLNVAQATISSHINKIINKIIKKYKEMYEDEYEYLFIKKGQYKKCSKCGEVKLVQHFNRDSSRKDGYSSMCKICRKEEYKYQK